MLALWPVLAPGTVSHVVMEHSSVVKLVEWNFLGGTDGAARRAGRGGREPGEPARSGVDGGGGTGVSAYGVGGSITQEMAPGRVKNPVVPARVLLPLGVASRTSCVCAGTFTKTARPLRFVLSCVALRRLFPK